MTNKKLFDGDDDCVVIADRITKVTTKGMLCEFGSEQIWLPLSQIETSGEEDDEDVKITVPFWLVEKNEIEAFIDDEE